MKILENSVVDLDLLPGKKEDYEKYIDTTTYDAFAPQLISVEFSSPCAELIALRSTFKYDKKLTKSVTTVENSEPAQQTTCPLKFGTE